MENIWIIIIGFILVVVVLLANIISTTNTTSKTSFNWKSIIKWGGRIILACFLGWLIYYFFFSTSKEKNSDNDQDYEVETFLKPLGEYICYPGQELVLPPIPTTQDSLKIRVNGHSHHIFYPSVQRWEFRDKRVEQYASPNVSPDDILRVRADSTEKEPFVVYLYRLTQVRLPKK